MPAGIQIFNDHGTIQIDENYANLALRHSGSSVSVTPSITGGEATSEVEITRTGDTPLLAYRSASETTLYRVDKSGSDWTWKLIVRGSPGQTVSWYIFDKPQDIGSNFGLQVFDSAGNLTFDALQKYMRIRDVIIESDYSSLVPFSRTWDSGRQYAWCPSKLIGYFHATARDVGGSGWEYIADLGLLGAKFINNGLSFDEMVPYSENTIGSGPEPISPYGVFLYRDVRGMAIDVTNF